MKDSLIVFGKQGRKILLVGMLASGLTACGHYADPTMSRMPTYDMPSAVVVQTPPVRLHGGHGGYGMPMASGPHYAPQGQFTAHQVGPNTMRAPGMGYQASPSHGVPQTMSRADGSTVIQQSPITVQRPSIVVPQQPVWVGNPPMPIPQPPVVIEQPPVVYEQPSVVVRPPQVEFSHPVRTTPLMYPPPVTGMPIQPQRGYYPQPTQMQPQPQQGYYPQSSQYQQQIPMAMGAPTQPRRMAAPATVEPTQQGPEDYLPPK